MIAHTVHSTRFELIHLVGKDHFFVLEVSRCGDGLRLATLVAELVARRPVIDPASLLLAGLGRHCCRVGLGALEYLRTRCVP